MGAVAGPLSRSVLVAGNPGGAIVGTDFPEVAETVREAIGSDRLRIDTLKIFHDGVIETRTADMFDDYLEFFLGTIGALAFGEMRARRAGRSLTVPRSVAWGLLLVVVAFGVARNLPGLDALRP